MALSFFAALACGILSGLGVGGGSLLMVWMTGVLCLEQRTAQGINLLYFLPTAAASLFFHGKNHLLDKNIALHTIPWGCLFAILGALLAMKLDNTLLRKGFGVFLFYVAFIELKKAFSSMK